MVPFKVYPPFNSIAALLAKVFLGNKDLIHEYADHYYVTRATVSFVVAQKSIRM